MRDISILGIETSCDETSAAVVKNGRIVRSNIISSQIEIHKEFGGVVPEVASRKHIELISDVVDQALSTAGCVLNDVDAVAVTCGPGLVGALLVGVAYAKGLAYSLGKPLIGVHHIEAHINANLIDNPGLEPDFVSLVVSGGHTHLVRVKDYGVYEVLGQTRDDAAGEAFDKVARALGLGYPGGPAIDLAACDGNENAISFPRALPDSYDFSFSGLKSSVLNYINKCAMIGEHVNTADVAASFQRAVVDVLVGKAIQVCNEIGVSTLTLAGGVACNSALRASMRVACDNNNILFYTPQPVYCTDNAAMVAATGYYSFLKESFSGLDLNAYPSLAL